MLSWKTIAHRILSEGSYLMPARYRSHCFALLQGAVGFLLLCALSQGKLFDFAINIRWMVAAALLFPLICAGAWFFAKQPSQLRHPFAMLGFVFALSMALGLRLDSMQRTGWDGLLLCFASALCLYKSAAGGFLALRRLLARFCAPVRLSPRRAFWLSFAVLIVCWLPVYLTFFPGINGYDAYIQLQQNLTRAYSANHPLLHTLLLGAFVLSGQALGSITAGFAAYTAFQYLLLAACFGYAMRYLASIRISHAAWWGILAGFALLIQHQVMAVSATKDVLFAGCVLVLCVWLCRMLSSVSPGRDKTRQLICVLLAAAACLLRNNMILAMAVLIAILLVVKRLRGRRLAALLLAGCMVSFGVNAGLKAVTHADGSSSRELVSIPSQQLSRVYSLYGLDEPVGYEIREVLPLADRYHPELSDHVKGTAQVTAPGQMQRFVKLWLREAIHFPIEYLDAFLLTGKGYWHLGDHSYSEIYVPYGERFIGAMVVLTEDMHGIQASNLLPAARSWFEEQFWHNGYHQHPVRWLLLHPALYTWLLAFVLVCAVTERKRFVLIPALVLLAYLCTLLLGACTLIRYHYCIMVTVPVLLGALTASGPRCKNSP